MELNETIRRIDTLKAELDKLRPIDAEREKRIMQKFRLEWNFHSNNLEGNSLTYGETKSFLLHGITADGKPLKDHLDIKGHNEAILLLDDIIKQNRPITESFIREVHQLILHEPYERAAVTPDGQPITKRIEIGKYKSQPNHVKTQTGEIFYFATPEETPAKMKELVEWLNNAISENKDHSLLIAAEFHYRFIRIHPFDDGNGRMARILMNLILMMKGFPPVIIKTQEKGDYFSALRQADGGNIEAFMNYVGMQLMGSLELMIKGVKGEKIEEANDVDKEIALLKARLNKDDDVKKLRSVETQIELFNSCIRLFIDSYIEKMQQFDELFSIKKIVVFKDGSGHPFNTKEDVINRVHEILYTDINFRAISLNYNWDDFKKAGVNTFDCKSILVIEFEKAKYTINAQTPDNTKIIKLYHEILKEDETKAIISISAKDVLRCINQQLI